MDDLVRMDEQESFLDLDGELFPAVVNDRCGSCDFRASCPAQPGGRQVIE